MVWNGTDIIIDVMHLNHLQTTLPPPSGPWKNCPLVCGAKRFKGLLLWTIRCVSALAVMLEMGRWWNPLPCLSPCEQFPPGHCFIECWRSVNGWSVLMRVWSAGWGGVSFPRQWEVVLLTWSLPTPLLLLCQSCLSSLSSLPFTMGWTPLCFVLLLFFPSPNCC